MHFIVILATSQETTHEQETQQVNIEITQDEKEEDAFDVTLSESDATQIEAEVALDVEQGSGSELDFVVDTTEESTESKTSEVKMTIEQEAEDADVVIGFQEENVEATQELSIKGAFFIQFKSFDFIDSANFLIWYLIISIVLNKMCAITSY